MALEDAPREADQNPAPARKQDRRRLSVELTGLVSRKFEQGLNHVVRRRILRALHTRHGETSPAELAENELADEALSNVAYHVSVLLRCGLISLARTEQVRGTIRHYYASKVKHDRTVGFILSETEKLDALGRGAEQSGS
jgi:DNA-binding transcriptional ArsR family regulator